MRYAADAAGITPMSSDGPVIDDITCDAILVDEAVQPAAPISRVLMCRSTHTARFQFGDDTSSPLPRCSATSGLTQLVWVPVYLCARP